MKFISRLKNILTDDLTRRIAENNRKLYEWNLIKDVLTERALNNKDSGVSDEQYFHECSLIVSLTTYGNRISNVYLPIESIMRQSVRPNRIILWLDNSMSENPLPVILERQIKRGLEVRFCSDIKSYKKIIPTLKLCPEDVIVTIDDDVIYRFDMLENLLRAYKKDPKYIYCNRMHRIRLREDKKSAYPYKDWEWEVKDLGVSNLNFPTGGAGTLYPPHCLSNEVIKDEVFMKICPKADDVWLKAMSELNGWQCKKVETFNDTLIFSTDDQQETALAYNNVYCGGNDIQIKTVFDNYKIWNLL